MKDTLVNLFADIHLNTQIILNTLYIVSNEIRNCLNYFFAQEI